VTAQTAAASTVHHPYGSPAGPGLFRVKNLQLPAYVQNVAHALQRSGSAKTESQAIGMAVGIVKRWAAGIGAKGKKVHPDVQAAAVRAVAEWEAAKATAHSSHANEAGDAVDLSATSPHQPAGSPTGGQFGTNSGGDAGKTPAQQHKLHQAHMAHLQRLVAQGKATPAQKAELARLTPKPAAVKTTAKVAKAPKAAAVKKPKTNKLVVNKKKGTVTATVNGKRVTMPLHEWHVIHVAHQQAVARQQAMKAGTKFAGDSDRFLELAFTEALAERVPPGRREGGRFTVPPAQLGRYDTPEQAAKVVNAMDAAQRAVVRSSTLPPPGMSWTDMDRLAIAVTG